LHTWLSNPLFSASRTTVHTASHLQVGFSEADASLAVSKLCALGAICPCSPVANQFVSPFFLVPKPDGSIRFILNLHQLNRFVPTDHFNMEDGRTVNLLLTQGDFLARQDLESAYFTVPVSSRSFQYLRFLFQGQLWEFVCLPLGLNIAPFVFIKVLKPVFKHLRALGHRSVACLDDFLLLGSSLEDYQLNVSVTISLFQSLGFVVNVCKSVTTPSTSIQFLELEYDSTDLSVSLPPDTQYSVLPFANLLISELCHFELAASVDVLYWSSKFCRSDPHLWSSVYQKIRATCLPRVSFTPLRYGWQHFHTSLPPA